MTEVLKPNQLRARNAIILIWIVLALEIASLISSYLQYQLLQSSALGEEIATDVASANDLREGVIGIAYLAAFIVSAVTFIQWFRRAYHNLHLKGIHLLQNENMASISWFIPFVNLYRPYQIMKELYLETSQILKGKGLSEGESLSTRLLTLWWTLWVISGLVGQVAFRLSFKAETIDQLTNSTVAGMMQNLIGIPLALVTVKVIQNYARVEPLLGVHEISTGDDILPEPRIE